MEYDLCLSVYGSTFRDGDRCLDRDQSAHQVVTQKQASKRQGRPLRTGPLLLLRMLLFDPHSVEGTMDEEHGDCNKDERQACA